MEFFEWMRRKNAIRPAFAHINRVAKEYWSYKEKYPNATYQEALLHAIRWRFNRAFFGGENDSQGSNLYGEFSDAEIIRIVKEYGHYGSINRVGAFVAGLELECDNLMKKGIEPFMWGIAKNEYNLSGAPWRPRNMEEVEKRYWKEMERKGLILKGNEKEIS